MNLKQNMHVKSESTYQKAQKETKEIIDTANKKALEIINEAKLFSVDEKQLIDQKLQKMVDNQNNAFVSINQAMEKAYHDAFSQTELDAVKLFSNVTKSLSDSAVSELAEFKSSLEKETVGNEQSISRRIEDAYQEVKNEIAVYKTEKMKEIDTQAGERIKAIAGYVLSQGLTIDQQEILIRSAIDELKKRIN